MNKATLYLIEPAGGADRAIVMLQPSIEEEPGQPPLLNRPGAGGGRGGYVAQGSA